MASSKREYDVVLLGATGYTGKYTAEQFARIAPTNLRWAVAGRSASKSEAIVNGLKSPDRVAPAIETCSLDPSDLDALAKKTTVVVNAVGPYVLYGEPVLRACVENGTHYLDTTGEVPWVRKMIEKYDEPAKKAHAIIIPQTGLESAMTDLTSLSLVNFLKEKYSASTRSVTASLQQLKSIPSGGTLDTVLANIATFSIADLVAAGGPFALAPKKRSGNRSLLQSFLGLRTVPGLGLLTTSLMTMTNAPIIHRSSALLGYGPHFRFEELQPAGNYIRGVAIHWALKAFPFLLMLPPIRWLLRRFVYKPGEGPSRESAQKERIEYYMIATADSNEEKWAFARTSFEGSMYDATGIFLVAAAITLLQDECYAKKAGGGLLTPASLGPGYTDRIKEAGVRMETGALEPAK